MSKNKLFCLGKFQTHSCYPWVWSKDRDCYYQECSLAGCSFSKTAKSLAPVGQTISIGGREHQHDWSHWKSTETPDGLYTPPWLYKRQCRVCNMEQKAEQLESTD